MKKYAVSFMRFLQSFMEHTAAAVVTSICLAPTDFCAHVMFTENFIVLPLTTAGLGFSLGYVWSHLFLPLLASLGVLQRAMRRIDFYSILMA